MELIRRVLRGMLLFIMLIVCAALLYVLVIMGDPRPGDTAEAFGAVAMPRLAEGAEKPLNNRDVRAACLFASPPPAGAADCSISTESHGSQARG